ncbi:MFS transporter [Anaeromicropila populeti]|uniref:Fucose permease n=1 Tax=Anaeromicropila populeti TaxID=37658 RepID=A0A1I6IDQ3_9FIRM|nr:MFS transporter [Anaeromicropila populeti]SFR64828.1 Fucose permease [Anaeromicropila populeti]
MTATLLLLVIYIAFISLGLPDSLLGSAWPSMYGELNVPVSYAGIISMIIAAGTILSSLYSDKIIRKFGTGIVTAASVAMTSAALLGFSFSHSFWLLCLWGIPYGMGAGSVDAALNNFVALHYKARHMSWLHCFWGIGATAGPYIMGLCLTNGLRWNSGYQFIGLMQLGLVLCLLLSLPLWKKNSPSEQSESQLKKGLSLKEIIELPGAKAILTAFFCYCALEATTGLWASSYMVLHKGIDAKTAAKWASLFYLGITLGRFICGFIADRLGNKLMIRMGQCMAAIGLVLLLAAPGQSATLVGLILTGIGCAPIYPSLLHQTPGHFGSENSQAIMGVQMACAYVGTTFMPPVFGFLAEHITIRLYPVYLILFVVLMVIMVERMNSYQRTKKR